MNEPRPPLLALTQGDPAGIGPEILLKLVRRWSGLETPGWRPLLVAERAALEALRETLPEAPWDRLRYLSRRPASAGELEDVFASRSIPVVDPVAEPRSVRPGTSGPADAAGALAALDSGLDGVTSGVVDALVTAPLSKSSIARHVLEGFTGHTDYLAEKAGLQRYGRDYLMTFLAPDLRVALLSTHVPLTAALDHVSASSLAEALDCLHRHGGKLGGRIAVAGIDPHAGEGGLLGTDDQAVVAPAVAEARKRGLDVHGPESADSVFARARQGEFDWVLALYHDQGLIAVKTAAFGLATNWTLGLPYLRTSVDHGTAFSIAGKGVARVEPLLAVVETTRKLLRRAEPKV